MFPHRREVDANLTEGVVVARAERDHLSHEPIRLNAVLTQDTGTDAGLLGQHSQQQVLGKDLFVVQVASLFLGVDDHPAGAFCEPIENQSLPFTLPVSRSACFLWKACFDTPIAMAMADQDHPC